MAMSKEGKYANDLISLENQLNSRFASDIGEILRGRGRTPEQIKESLIYVIEDQFAHIERAYNSKD